MPDDDYEAVIGLEVHVQLATQTKLFCGCRHDFGAPPNSNTCPVCLGLPGALPVLNREALRLGVLTALSFECTVARFTKFDRKNYYYPDSPKGYQISQFDFPYATGGAVEFEREDGSRARIELERIHLEEDAGKLLHEDRSASAPARSLVDLNRCGTPLLEIVSRPEVRSARDAYLYVRAIRDRVRWIGVSNANMEEGSLRCDVNVSVRRAQRPGEESQPLGTRVEVKNLNSFSSVEAAVTFEFSRQLACLAAGQTIVHETRLYDADLGETRPMREKEDAHDYRYFPEPDLPSITIPTAWVEQARAQLPEPAAVRARRYQDELGLSRYDAQIITMSRARADYFDGLLAAGLAAKDASNWFQTEILRELNDRGIRLHEFPLQQEQIAVIVRAVAEERVSVATGREVFREAVEGGADPAELLAQRGEQVSDRGELEAWVDAVLAEHPDAVDKVRADDDKPLAFLVGQVMKRSKGQANPRVVAQLIPRRIRE